ncbi:MAG: AEC family transporter, partial [Polynucleobacter sp.]|nr:AEC family transporter [Polynucleobacter sp.]
MPGSSDPLLRIISIVFPIFAVMAIGWVYARYRRDRGGIDMAFANELNMDVFVPALVISAMATKSFDPVNYRWLALGALLVMLGSGLLAWWLSILLREQAKTFVPPVMFVNAGNMGLPLMVLAFGEDALPAAVVLFFVENTLHYTLGTWLLDHRARWWNLWRNPVIVASLVGIGLSLTKIELWQPLYLAIKMLGEVAVPLLLFSLGVRLAVSSLSDFRIGMIGAIASPALGMALAALCIPLLDLSGRDAAMLMVFGALPPAVLNFVFAERYRQEPAKVASMVMLGNLGALVSIP